MIDHASPIRLSVVLICYNQAHCIADSLGSVLSQTAYDRLHEILVIDDHSRDGAAEIAERLARDHPKVRVIRRKTNSGGAAIPRNDGMAIATGTHVAFLDADDIWAIEKTAISLDVLEAQPNIGLLYCDFVAFDKEGTERRTVCTHIDRDDAHQLEKLFVRGGPILPSCAIVNRGAIEKVGMMDPQLKFNEESEFWFRLLTAMPAQRVPRALVRKREWMGSLGSTKYGLQNLAAKRQITEMMLARVPVLARVVHLREAQIEFKTAVHFFAVGDTRSARIHLRKALEIDTSLHKARLYLVLSYLSSDPETLLRLVRSAGARISAIAR